MKEVQRQIDFLDGMKGGIIIGLIMGTLVGYALCACIYMVKQNGKPDTGNTGRGQVEAVDGVLKEA